MPQKFDVDSENVEFTNENELLSNFSYRRNEISHLANGKMRITPKIHNYQFKTQLKPKKTGLMLVGWGGNNGTTVTGAIIANREKMSWATKSGEQHSNYWGSITQSSTVHIGYDGSKQVYLPFNEILPMVDPNQLILDGWDINGANLYEGMRRAQVFEPELQRKLRTHMEQIVPRPSIYYPDFIASNQEGRADHVLKGSKQEHVDQIRADIRQFKQLHNLECVLVLWTANTERYSDVKAGLNRTSAELLASIKRNESEVAPSHVFAVAAILEGAHYINGSPQNSLVPGVVELAREKRVFVGGDDFKSGQTKLKSVLVDFLVQTGLKPQSIVSYNHLGNNDGKNLSEQRQFRSKEITKSSVVDDVVESNQLLFPSGQRPDHVIVIKYVPFVSDSKRAMDEYVSSIFMGGLNTLAIHNTCEDSLLAAPLILDLAILTELCTRIAYSDEEGRGPFKQFESVLSLLSCLLKAPVVPEGSPVCNALMRQLKSVTKLLTVCAGFAADTDFQLEFFTQMPQPTTVFGNAGHSDQEKIGKASQAAHTNGTDYCSGNDEEKQKLTNGYHCDTNGVVN